MAARPKLNPGAAPTDISITEWNRHVDSSNAYHQQQSRGSGRSPGGFGGGDSNIVKVKNASGGNRSAGQILEFNGWALGSNSLAGDTPVIWLQGGSPTLANGFGVLVRPIPSNDMDDCQVSGAAVALVNVTVEAHKFAKPASGNYVLQSASSGPVRILYKPNGTGEKVCAVLLGATSPLEIHRGETAEQIDQGDTGTVNRYEDGTDDPTGDEDEVFNGIAPVASGKVVIYVKLGTGWALLNTPKTQKTFIMDFAEGSTHIEAEELNCWVDTVATEDTVNKIEFTDECPEEE